LLFACVVIAGFSGGATGQTQPAEPNAHSPQAAPTPNPAQAPTSPPAPSATPQPQTDSQQPQTGPQSNTESVKLPARHQDASEKPKKHDRILGVIPNYRTVEDEEKEPARISAGEKFKLGLEDSFDYYAYPAAGLFAGMNMWQKQTPSFGQGAAGFGKYYGAAFADQTIANMMSESVFPTMLHQDPRYFPRAKGRFWKRTRYAISREWITRNDSGKNTFNVSELGGNAAAVAISNAYYPSENRNVSDNVYKYGQQIGLDAFFNVLKEFWPDMRRKMFSK
jgi:hypothetical protein